MLPGGGQNHEKTLHSQLLMILDVLVNTTSLLGWPKYIHFIQKKKKEKFVGRLLVMEDGHTVGIVYKLKIVEVLYSSYAVMYLIYVALKTCDGMHSTKFTHFKKELHDIEST